MRQPNRVLQKDISMTTLSKKQQAALASIALEGLVRKYRKEQPHLTAAQAFTKVYEDPANSVLRRAERNASYQAIGFDKELSVPVHESSAAESGAAYAFCMKAAERMHAIDPSKTVAGHFTKIFAANDGVGLELRKSDRRERRLPEPMGE
jgi:hypothetical protein